MEKEKEKKLEEKVERNTKHIWWLTIVMIVLLVAAALGGYLAGASRIANEVVEQKNEVKEETTNKKLTLDEAKVILDKLSLTLDGKLKKAFGDGIPAYKRGYDEIVKLANTALQVDSSKKTTKTCDELYKGKAEEDFGYYKTAAGACKIGGTTETIKYDDFNSVYKELYGTEAPKKAFTGTDSFYAFYDYHSEGNFYNQNVCGACGGSSVAHPVAFKILSVEEKDGTAEITVLYEESDVIFINDTYKYSFTKQEYDQVDGDAAIKEIANDYIKNHENDAEKYTITLEKSGNHYIFKNLVKKMS